MGSLGDEVHHNAADTIRYLNKLTEDINAKKYSSNRQTHGTGLRSNNNKKPFSKKQFNFQEKLKAKIDQTAN